MMAGPATGPCSTAARGSRSRLDARLAAGEGDEALAALARERAGIEAQASEIEPARGGADRRKAQVHQLHRLAVGGVAEGLAVEPLEGRDAAPPRRKAPAASAR